MADNKKEKKALTPADKAINAIIAVVIVAVLALAVWAVAPKVKQGWENMQPLPDTTIVSGMAENLGMTVDEFKAEFGLAEDVTGESLMNDVFTEEFVNALTLDKYAKLNKTTYEEFVAQMGIADKVTEASTWGETEPIIPFGNYVGGEEAFNQLKEYYGLDDTITMDTPTGEALPIVEQKMAEMQAAQEAAAAEAETAEDVTVEGTEEVTAEEAPAEGTETTVENSEAPAAE